MPALRRFFKTPKGLLLLVLAALLGLASPVEGLALVMPGLAAAVAAAALVDLVVLRMRAGRWEFPSGAVLTGLLVAMVLSPHEPWAVAAITAVVGVLSKYVFRTRLANVFNPAALAIVVTFYAFDTGQSWWGALPDLSLLALGAVFVTGVFVADRVNKVPLVLAFLGSYYLLFTMSAYVGDPARVAEIYRTPDLHAALFFAFFILTDPPTSPARYPHQVACGAIVALASFAVFEVAGAAHFLLSGLLVGNLWEAWRRWNARQVYA